VLVPALSAVQRGVKTIVFAPMACLGRTIVHSPLRVMSSEELALLSRAGVCIGGHGYSHIDWQHYSKDYAQLEIQKTYEMLDAFHGTGSIIEKLLAPPHGSYTRELYEYALDIGFSEVYGTISYPSGHYGTERFLANRSGYSTTNCGSTCISWPWEK